MRWPSTGHRTINGPVLDVCLKAFHPSARLEIMVATTTATCRDAQAAHELAPTSAVALGRLITGAGLLGLHHKLPGSLSLQVLSQSRIKMMYADSTHEGHVRGYVKEPQLAFPLSRAERDSGRRSIGAAVAPGKLSLVRIDAQGRYSQSATPLVSGEIDADIAHFIARSDQVDNAMACEVHLDDNGTVHHAAGVMIQALPDGNRAHLALMRERLAEGLLTRLVREGTDAPQMLTAIDAEAAIVESPAELRWQCRCSQDRVRRSLSLFEIKELMELIEIGEPVSVRCDMCTKNYLVSIDEVREVLERLIKAQA